MRTLLACLIFPGFFITSTPALSASTLLGCEKETREDRIQVCSTIIDTKKVSGKPASQHILALAYYYRGFAYREKLLYDQAIEDYDRAIDLDPAITMAYYHKGNILWSLGQLERAIDSYDQVIALNPKYPEAYFSRAEAYYYQGQTERAAEDYTTALELDPTLIHVWTALRRLNIQPGPGSSN